MCHSKIEPKTYITSSFMLLCSFLHRLQYHVFSHLPKTHVFFVKAAFATRIKTDHSTLSSSSSSLFLLLIIKAVKRVELEGKLQPQNLKISANFSKGRSSDSIDQQNHQQYQHCNQKYQHYHHHHHQHHINEPRSPLSLIIFRLPVSESSGLGKRTPPS